MTTVTPDESRGYLGFSTVTPHRTFKFGIGYIWAMPQTLLLCNLDLQSQGHWWPLKGQILAIFSHFGPVLICRELDHPMAGIYNTYICPL